MARKTIEHVAALAGVSIKTVSRVLNDEPSVRGETRRRVQEAMAALNYQPSLHARSLAGRRSSLIGLVYDNPSGNYVFTVQSGAIARCRESKLRLFIQPCDGVGDRLTEEVLAMVEQTHVDGLVLTPPLSGNAALIGALRERALPYVLIAPDAEGMEGLSVAMDDRAAARDMTDHLIALGHRRIGFVAGHPAHGSSRWREQGWRESLESHRIEAPADLVAQGYNNGASGREAGHRLLGLAKPPTAIFASNDDMAGGVILAAHERGLELPRQLSVAGFDDTEFAGLIWPTLTTIHQPVYDMAYGAVGLLVELIRGEEAPRNLLLAHHLVRRASTCAPAPRPA